jgi:hypothetical protein
MVLIDFVSIQLLANTLHIDVYDFFAGRLDHLPPVELSYFTDHLLVIDTEQLCSRENNPNLNELCSDIPDDTPILRMMINPEQRPDPRTFTVPLKT